MKDKNLPDDNNSQTLDELTKDINQIIEQLEKEKNLENSLNNYQKLIKLNNPYVTMRTGDKVKLRID